MLLRARIVLPVTQLPIEDGGVLISGKRIVAVGNWKELRAGSSAEVVDLGESILLPGLVNAHCHLDYTGMAGQLSPPKRFPDWIKSLLALKAQWSYADYARSWLEGAKMLVRNGATTVGDIESVPELLPELWTTTTLRVLSFLEMTGVKSQGSPHAILREAVQKIEGLPQNWNQSGLSPHAPYSTAPELLRLTANIARARQWRVTTHVAESEAEFDMFMYRRGPLFDWLKDQRDLSDCGHGSPVQALARQGLLGANFLAVHANYLWEDDARLLAESGAHVVHCPSSHAYFGHRRFPRRELATAGVNICLGTDSLASTQRKRAEPLELDMFAEMRALAAASSDLSPAEILRMATLHGARALGLAGQVGEIAVGACADLIAIPQRDTANDSHDTALNHTGAVRASMIDGQWVIVPHAG